MTTVCALIRARRFRYSGEKQLQGGLAQALGSAGIAFEREVRLAPGDIIDFLLPDGVGIEVKIDGSLSALERQLARYAKSDRIRSMVVVTSLSRLALQLPPSLGGKPITVVRLAGGFA